MATSPLDLYVTCSSLRYATVYPSRTSVVFLSLSKLVFTHHSKSSFHLICCYINSIAKTSSLNNL
jgi:hypothetical protein